MAMAAAPEQLQRPSSPSPAIRVLHTAHVHPSPPSPELSVPLTLYDVFWLRAPPVQRVFLYRLEPDVDVDAVVSNLKCSLAQALRGFLPLAGRLRLTPSTANRHELHYRPGDAVTFTVAESDDDVEYLAADEPREVSRLAVLAPPLPEYDAVLALKATVFKSGGLALGATVHHAACDGAASTHFLHTWAACCAGTTGTRPPPDPPVISDPMGLYNVFFRAVAPSTEDMNRNMSNDEDKQLLFGTFVLSRAHLQRVKDDLVAAARGVAPPQRCSSLVATLGLVWSCHHRDRANIHGSRNKKTGCLLFTVDHRSRLNPPLPDKYLGNCVGPALATVSTAQLREAGRAVDRVRRGGRGDSGRGARRRDGAHGLR
ncbi:hypothetical protein QOZ80_9BG0699960 [Eleusine coracana subsp. coracana]|nr:hypothetical protein QOZ80_9BG0699960 [Eleusine coracana subsp. coracana]